MIGVSPKVHELSYQMVSRLTELLLGNYSEEEIVESLCTLVVLRIQASSGLFSAEQVSMLAKSNSLGELNKAIRSLIEIESKRTIENFLRKN